MTLLADFASIDVNAPFTEAIVVRLNKIARTHGTFIRRPLSAEPFILDLPPQDMDPSVWVKCLLGSSWRAGDTTVCETFDGPSRGLRVRSPERAQDSPTILLHGDNVDTSSPLWEALRKVEPTLAVQAQTLTRTWVLLSRSARSYRV